MPWRRLVHAQTDESSSEAEDRERLNRDMLRSGAATARLATMRSRHAALFEEATSRALTAAEARELNWIEHALGLLESLTAKRREADDLEELLSDAELKDEAASELEALGPGIVGLEAELVGQLLPKDDEAALAAALVEVRAGAGGDEATAFAGELLEMYQKYAVLRRWKFEVLDASRSEYGGVKAAFALVEGDDSYASLRFESGVHRVQRVPDNDARIHTSTASVVVFPQDTQERRSSDLPSSELKIETYRSGGAGGQHVNTTDSAVRITHLPTGIQVAIQDERSQHRNKAKALKLLNARVSGLKAEQDRLERQELRDKLSGTGNRAERVRTYNFQHDRVVDHRSHFTANSVARTLDGILLHDILHSLKLKAQDAKLQAFLNE